LVSASLEHGIREFAALVSARKKSFSGAFDWSARDSVRLLTPWGRLRAVSILICCHAWSSHF
jgi:hypothetical protein